MNSAQPEEVLAESVGQIPARGPGSMIRGSKNKGEALLNGRAVSAQPALRYTADAPPVFPLVITHK